MGQKDLLIETQGNWGDVRTGDDAAAPRYIEARLSKFALEVAFNAKTTEWQLSYDGRKQEPVVLPMKFPLVLAQGADGIAVGLINENIDHTILLNCAKLPSNIYVEESLNVLLDFLTWWS
jgi:topoisomerase-4 subunit A